MLLILGHALWSRGAGLEKDPNARQGWDPGEAGEPRNIRKCPPKNSVIKINDILMPYFKKKKKR